MCEIVRKSAWARVCVVAFVFMRVQVLVCGRAWGWHVYVRGWCVQAQIIAFNDLSLHFVPHMCNVFTITIDITTLTSTVLLKQSTVM